MAHNAQGFTRLLFRQQLPVYSVPDKILSIICNSLMNSYIFSDKETVKEWHWCLLCAAVTFKEPGHRLRRKPFSVSVPSLPLHPLLFFHQCHPPHCWTHSNNCIYQQHTMGLTSKDLWLFHLSMEYSSRQGFSALMTLRTAKKKQR